MRAKYDKAEANIDKITTMLEQHQITLMKDVAMLDKMYETNKVYFRELTMYILAGKKKLKKVQEEDLPALKKRPRKRACRKTPRLQTIFLPSATGLKRKSTIWNSPG